MNRLHAAAAQVDLQPVAGARLTGFATRLDPSVGSHDPLMGKALLLDDGSTRLASLALDLIGLSVADAAELRRLVAEAVDMPAGNVLVSCTHTHSGPSSMPFRGDLAQVDRAWLTQVLQSIAGAAAALPARLRPARLAHAIVPVPNLGYNRQDGASPIDERLLVARVTADDDDRQVIATILNYATHPVVLGERNLMFCGDYPGCATRLVEQAAGGVAMFVLGAAGDVDPVVYRDRGRQAGTFAVAEEMGRQLAAAADRAIAAAPRRSDVRITIAERHVAVPLDAPPSREAVADLKAQLLARRGPAHAIPSSSEGKWAMFELAWVDDLERAVARNAVPRELQVELTGVRIGELHAVTCPFEIYSQIGLDIRQQLAPRPVIIAGYTNGLIGYVPTDRAKQQGGYGPAASHRFFPHLLTAVGCGADAALVRAALELLRSLADHAALGK